MVINLKNKKLNITYTDESIILPENVQEKIDLKWEEITNENPMLWNGEITCVSDFCQSDDEIKILCQKSNYAHYLYEERIGLPKEYACCNLSGECLIETSDGYYLIGELDEKMSYPHILQFTGGNVDKKDITNGIVNIMETISRETTEELNIDLYDKNQVSEVNLKYIYKSEQDEQPGVLIFAKTKINMTAKQMEEHYNNYYEYLKENNLELEFGKIHLIPKNEAINFIENSTNPKRHYLTKIIKEDLLN